MHIIASETLQRSPGSGLCLLLAVLLIAYSGLHMFGFSHYINELSISLKDSLKAYTDYRHALLPQGPAEILGFTNGFGFCQGFTCIQKSRSCIYLN